MSIHAVEKSSWSAFGRMGVVAGMHLALVLVLANSFGLIPKLKHPDNIDVVKVDDSPPVDARPPDIPYVPPTTDVFVPMPDVPEVEPVDDPPRIVAKELPPGGGEIGHGSAVVEGLPDTVVRTDPRHPLTQPRYPAQRIREQVEGVVDVEVYVQPDGRVGDARIARSSGYDDFDRSALDEARRNWRLVPATRNGQAIAQWFRMRVSFKLKNQP
jgi:protein TonB